MLPNLYTFKSMQIVKLFLYVGLYLDLIHEIEYNNVSEAFLPDILILRSKMTPECLFLNLNLNLKIYI